MPGLPLLALDSQSAPPLSPLRLSQPPVFYESCFCFIDKVICVVFYILDTSGVIEHLSFSYLVWSSLRLCCCKWHSLILFYGRGIFHCVCVSLHHIFFICSFVHGHLGSFHVLAIVNCASMNIGMHVSISIILTVFFFLVICPGMELLDHMVILVLVFWGTSILLSTVVAPT